jgi:hypothetical protein
MESMCFFDRHLDSSHRPSIEIAPVIHAESADVPASSRR